MVILMHNIAAVLVIASTVVQHRELLMVLNFIINIQMCMLLLYSVA